MTQTFDAAISGFVPELPVAVAFSGGADSTALLVACSRRWPGQVVAIHVHHGLQQAADGFVHSCQELCAALGVPLVVSYVDGRHAPGQSPEDAARLARYGALDEALDRVPSGVAPARSVALAQHADDQVETLLLALSRGAGIAGLACMPQHWSRGGRIWHRPLLRVAASDIRRWLVSQSVQWVEDPSNQDETFTRNRIRLRLLPVIASVFPAFRDTFTRSAAHAAQASQLLEEIAHEDLSSVGTPPSLQLLQAMGRSRQANVLRFWLRSVHQTTPSTAQLSELLDQVAACTTRGHRIHLKIGRGFVLRKGAWLDWHPS